jgi:lysosomal alpha-mannosidase
MNDRAQGGSSLAPGRIELMQNRRIPCDDIKGVNEFLNERDEDGKG